MSQKIENVLISLSDKSDIEKVLKVLKKYKINIISSGGTYKEIIKLGYSCTEISKYTKFNEMLDGRVKTLHPKIHAGILSKRSNKKHKVTSSDVTFSFICAFFLNLLNSFLRELPSITAMLKVLL